MRVRPRPLCKPTVTTEGEDMHDARLCVAAVGSQPTGLHTLLWYFTRTLCSALRLFGRGCRGCANGVQGVRDSWPGWGQGDAVPTKAVRPTPKCVGAPLQDTTPPPRTPTPSQGLPNHHARVSGHTSHNNTRALNSYETKKEGAFGVWARNFEGRRTKVHTRQG